ncbi:MAG: S41 family peptidase, partial [Candidatus Kapabacteria bacterium]|nr:S41 family peptidase [Candidatus Kapabacteria bacterium]
ILTRFAETTYDEMMSAVNNLKQQGMKRMILDLRGNPGGYLTQAYKIADEFIPGGNMIVYTKGRRPEFDESYTSSEGGTLEDIPLIVMVNAGSASASEIVSGAIQDLDRGLVVGTTSFGKGLVQRQYELEDGASFRLTISRYYTPSGRSIQRPYKDKDVAAYRNLVGRLELEEGANVEHSFEKLKKDEKNKDAKDKDKINFDSIKTYKSKAGRMLLGGGGITPDFIVKGDTSRLTKMVSKVGYSVYNEIANDYLHTDEGAKFKEKYKNNFTDFLRNYEIPKSIYNLYKEVLKAKKIDWVQDDFDKDKDFIDMFIKRRIARIIWDRNKDAQIFSTIDRQLTKAVALFPESEKVRKMK